MSQTVQISPSDDDGVGKEEHPNAVPSRVRFRQPSPEMTSQQEYAPLAVLGNDCILVSDPVLVPTPDGSGVVNAENVDVLHFKSGAFKLENRQ